MNVPPSMVPLMVKNAGEMEAEAFGHGTLIMRLARRRSVTKTKQRVPHKMSWICDIDFAARGCD